MADSDDDTLEIPLVDQRIFGGAIKLKRVKFVPESTSENSAALPKQPTASEASQRYLDLVLPKTPEEENNETPTPPPDPTTTNPICEICKAPINPTSSRPHEASIVHQIALQHTNPPLSFDRSSKGHSYLQRYGWNANERKGLGASGAGRLFPIKVKEKNDTVGLGMKFEKPPGGKKIPEKKVEKLGAKAIQKRDKAEKKRAKKVHDLFYQDDEVRKYLGELG